jgi:hypothetical protein
LFVLRTGLDDWLSLDGAQLALAVPRGGPQGSVLIAADGRSIGAGMDGPLVPAISVRLRRVPGGRVELRHPVQPGRYLGVVAGAPARALFDRVGDKVLDRFELRPVTEDFFTPEGLALLREACRALAPPMGGARLLALLRDGHVRPGLAAPLIRVLQADELALLARLVVAAPEDLAILRRAMGEDPWMTILERLVAWDKAGRPPTRRAALEPADTHVSVLQSGAARPQAGLALVSVARRGFSARKVSAVLGTTRGEAPNILEWVAHHRACGFDHVIIYSAAGEDGCDALLGLLADHGEIGWVKVSAPQGVDLQWMAHGHAFKALPDLLDYRWTMVLQLDEYVGFRGDLFGNVAELIGWHEYQQADAIALRSLIFDAAQADVGEDRPSTERFLERAAEVGPAFKSLVRSNLFWDAQRHFPYPTLDLPFSYRWEDGAPCHQMAVLKGMKAPAAVVSADTAWVARYDRRGAEEPALTARVRDDRTMLCGRGAAAHLARLRGLVKQKSSCL